MKPNRLRQFADIVMIALIYAIAGKVGQLAAIPPGNVTPIWPSSGLALAVVLMKGNPVAPAIWLGSIFVNLSVFLMSEEPGHTFGMSLITSILMGGGAMLGALVGANLVRKNCDNPYPFTNTRDVVKFVWFGGVLSCLISPTIGNFSLAATGMDSWSNIGRSWLTWWLGDLAGVLVLTPTLLIWNQPRGIVREDRTVSEKLFYGILLLVASVAGFWGQYPLGHFIIPVLVWGAFRFGHRGATLAIVAVSTIAICGAVAGMGPFVQKHFSLNESLLLLQGFIATVAVTMLILTAVITEREAATSEVIRYKDHLVELVDERTKDLIEQKEETEKAMVLAQEANRAKSAFLTNMSHELRTPLNAIIGYSEMLQEEAPDNKSSADLRKIETSGKHLLALINDILDLSKIEAGKMELSLEEFPLTRLIEDVRSMVKPLVARNNNSFEVIPHGDPGMLYADILRTRQILFNLISNAAKFTRDGIISLSIERKLLEQVEWIVFSVKDTGIGMTGNQMERLFQAFSQGDSSIFRNYGGTGLGLVISRRFAQMMGGDIQVDSEPGKGTIFVVTIPSDLRNSMNAAGDSVTEPQPRQITNVT